MTKPYGRANYSRNSPLSQTIVEFYPFQGSSFQLFNLSCLNPVKFLLSGYSPGVYPLVFFPPRSRLSRFLVNQPSFPLKWGLKHIVRYQTVLLYYTNIVPRCIALKDVLCSECKERQQTVLLYYPMQYQSMQCARIICAQNVKYGKEDRAIKLVTMIIQKKSINKYRLLIMRIMMMQENKRVYCKEVV